MQLGWCDFTTISFSVFPIAEPPIVTFKVKWRWYDSWFPVSLGFLGAKEKQLVWATSSLAHVIALVNVTTTNWSLVGLYRGWRLDSPGLPVLELPATNQKNELEQRWCFWIPTTLKLYFRGGRGYPPKIQKTYSFCILTPPPHECIRCIRCDRCAMYIYIFYIYICIIYIYIYIYIYIIYIIYIIFIYRFKYFTYFIYVYYIYIHNNINNIIYPYINYIIYNIL